MQLGQQCQHVGGIHGHLVAHGVCKPVTLAPPHYIRADDAGEPAQFGSQLAFHRAMNNIREALGMPRCTDTGYQREQNELRKALIRNWKGM